MENNDDIFKLPDGTQFHMPFTEDRLPWRKHAWAVELNEEMSLARTQIIEMIVGKKVAHAILDEEIVDWACLSYPLCTDTQMRVLVDWSLFEVVYDDLLSRTDVVNDSCSVQRISNLRVMALENDETITNGPLVQWARELGQKLKSQLSAILVTRWRQINHDIAENVPKENTFHRVQNLPDLEGLVKIRKFSLFGYHATFNAEFSSDIDMSDSFDQSAKLRDFERVAVEHVMFVNDLHSFVKENREGEYANSYFVLRRVGLTVQEAVNELAAKVILKQDELIARSAAILESSLRDDFQVRRYMQAILLLCGGNLRYHRTSRRYWGSSHDGRPVNDCLVTVVSDGVRINFLGNLS